MALTVKRGVFRLSLILMIIWNLLVVWFLFRSAQEDYSRSISMALEMETTCAKDRPFSECNKEYQQNISGFSQWAEFKKQFTASDIAVIEVFPPLAVGLVWGILWGVRATARWVLHGFGLELGTNRVPGQSVAVSERFRTLGGWIITPRNIVTASVALAAISVSYYFLVSLPASNRQRLQFEKETAAAAKTERDNKEEAAAQEARDRQVSFEQCAAEADMAYQSYVKLNGSEVPGKPGTYSASTLIFNNADKRKADALAECHRQFDPIRR